MKNNLDSDFRSKLT